MYIKVMIICFMMAVAASIVVLVLYSPGISGDKEDLTQLYESSIINKIEKCEAQADLLHTSRSATLRNYAELQVRKAQFFDAEKKMLINIMFERNLEPKQYRIEHFLDEQFYKSIAK